MIETIDRGVMESGTDGIKVIGQSILLDMSRINDDEYVDLCADAISESVRLRILGLR